MAKMKRIRSPRSLELHQKRLNYLALHFDPFQAQANQECQQIITFYELDTLLDNPFAFTNTILQMLDLLEEKRKTLA
jgi:hypothetical protein